jgi:hypothetical protein
LVTSGKLERSVKKDERKYDGKFNVRDIFLEQLKRKSVVPE